MHIAAGLTPMRLDKQAGDAVTLSLVRFYSLFGLPLQGAADAYFNHFVQP